MADAPSINDLFTQLQQQVTNGNLVITPQTIAIDNIQRFVTSLPDAQLELEQVAFDPAQGPVAQSFSVAGQTPHTWPIQGISSAGLTEVAVTITFTQADASSAITATLNATGWLPIPNQSLAVTGNLESTNNLVFTLADDAGTMVSLADIAAYASNSMMNSYLPTGVAVLEVVPVTALLLTFGFEQGNATACSFTSDTGGEWNIADAVSLTDVGVTFTASYTYPTMGIYQSSFGGNIHATFTLDQPYTVSLYFQPGEVWELRIEPGDGNVLPALDALANLLGGQQLETLVDNGLQAIGLTSIAVKAVRIQFNYVTLRLLAIRIDGQITVAEVAVDVFVSLPVFQFGGSLASGSQISIKALAEHYFNASEGFPDVDITNFSIFADPTNGTYQISAGIEAHTFHIGPVYLEGVNFDLTYSSGTVGGGINADFFIGNEEDQTGVNILVSATSDDITSGGWIFEGKTATGQPIPIGDFLAYLGNLFHVTVPDYFSQITLEDILIRLNTGTGDFVFDITGHFPMAGQPVTMNVSISLTNNAGVYTKTLTGQVIIGTAVFDVAFNSNDQATSFTATFNDPENPLTIEAMFEIFGFTPPTIPTSLDLGITEAGFIYNTATNALVLFGHAVNLFTLPGENPADNFGTAMFLTDQPSTPTDSPRRYIFGVNVTLSINLSNLPLIGQEFSPSETLAIQNLQVLIASTALSAQAVTALNPEIAPTGFTLPAPGVSQGISFSGTVNMGGLTTSVSAPVTATPPAPGSNAPAPALPDSTSWITLQKSFGPVTFKRIGVLYQNEQVFFKLDASLGLGGLGLTMDGLSISSPLTDFEPSFHLDGIGVSFIDGPLDIAGSFLSVHVDPSACAGPDECYEYAGGVTIMFEGFGFAALGSYAKLGSFASLFVFAEIDFPLGGIPAFFITGLNGGFGYNSRLRVPGLNEVYRFPFVAGLSNPDVMGGQGGKPPTPLDVLDVLERGKPPWVTPKAGEDWLALGLSFTTYELVNSRALMVAQFGQAFELALIGLATMQLPKGLPESSAEVFAYVELQLEAVFVPSDGFLGISAVLSPNSYLLDKSCHPTGGFALYLWVAGDHAGDFVLSIGGYHPSFTVPAWYPQVPRVGFNWPISKQISIKGEAYCALTPALIMAGGLLNANYTDGDLQAWFTAQADFLIGWQPFFYQASIGVSVGASYKLSVLGIHKTVSAEIGATLDLWGPATGGTVTVHWSIISFTVSFGASKALDTTPLTWNEFAADSSTKLLPDADSILTVSPQKGLLMIDQGTTDAPHAPVWIARPAGFDFLINSSIPASALQLVNQCNGWSPSSATSGITIRPMSKTGVISTLALTVELLNAITNMDGWTVEARTASVPAGLWGPLPPSHQSPNANQPGAVPNQMVGFNVKAPASTIHSSTGQMELENLGAESVSAAQPMPLVPAAPPLSTATPTKDTAMIATIMQTVNDATVAQNRTNIFNALQSLYANLGESPTFTDGSLANLATEAGGIYADAPLAPPTSSEG